MLKLGKFPRNLVIVIVICWLVAVGLHRSGLAFNSKIIMREVSKEDKRSGDILNTSSNMYLGLSALKLPSEFNKNQKKLKGVLAKKVIIEKFKVWNWSETERFDSCNGYNFFIKQGDYLSKLSVLESELIVKPSPTGKSYIEAYNVKKDLKIGEFTIKPGFYCITFYMGKE